MSKILWTKDEVEYLEELYSQGLSLDKISELIGKSASAISSKANQTGISKKYIRNNNPNFKAIYQDYDWCYENYIINGFSIEEMAELCGAKKRVVEKWCREKYGLCNRTARDYIKLNEKQRELIIYSMLGDGHIDKRENQSLFIVSHAENQKDYLFWKYEILKNLCNKSPSYIKPQTKYFNGVGYMCQGAYRCATKIITELKYIKALSKKEIVEMLNEFGLSIFFLDDGSRDGCCWTICVAEFSDEDRETFCNVLKDRFNIECRVRKDTRYIGFSKSDSKLIDEIILRSIPNDLDIIKYKILDKQEKVG